MRTGILVPTLLLLVAAPLAAQMPSAVPAPRHHLGLTLDVAQPMGAFADSIDTSFGVDVNYLLRADRAGILGLRVDGGVVMYGSEERRVLLSPTVGGRITTDLTTTNTIAHLTAGPQLMVPGGRLRPYLNAAAGFAYFSTDSYLEGRNGETFANTSNFDDAVFTYGGGAGVYVPVGRGRLPVSLDFGVRYRHTGEVAYLREGSIRDRPNGTIDFVPIRSDSDILTFSIGATVGLRKTEKRAGRER